MRTHWKFRGTNGIIINVFLRFFSPFSFSSKSIWKVEEVKLFCQNCNNNKRKRKLRHHSTSSSSIGWRQREREEAFSGEGNGGGDIFRALEGTFSVRRQAILPQHLLLPALSKERKEKVISQLFALFSPQNQ